MPASLLHLTYEDASGDKGTFSLAIQGGIQEDNAELLALVQAIVNMSNTQLKRATLSQTVDISGLTNPAPVLTGKYTTVRDQAVFQGVKEDQTSFVRTSVPAPVDSIFIQTGPSAFKDVDETAALVTAFTGAALAAPIAGELWRAVDDDLIDFDKGWRKGQAHS